MADENPPRSAPSEVNESPIQPSALTDTVYAPPAYRRSKRRRNILNVAAAVVVLVGGLFLWRYLSSYESTTTPRRTSTCTRLACVFRAMW
jgi:hypothetical protein